MRLLMLIQYILSILQQSCGAPAAGDLQQSQLVGRCEVWDKTGGAKQSIKYFEF
jgi:hypothetical protein